jgi:hypothetical protein
MDLVGPTAKDYRWQAQEHNGYALTDFSIDWEHEQARCPQGNISSSWTPTWTRNQEIIKIKFGFATCGAVPCTQSAPTAARRNIEPSGRINSGLNQCIEVAIGSIITNTAVGTTANPLVRRRDAHFALEATSQREKTEVFKKEYAKRAGVEGVHAEASSLDGLAAFALHWRASDPSSARRDRNS